MFPSHDLIEQLSKAKRKIINEDKIKSPRKGERDTQFIKKGDIYYFVVDGVELPTKLTAKKLEDMSGQELQEEKKKEVTEYNVQAKKENSGYAAQIGTIRQKYPSLSQGNNPTNVKGKSPTQDKKPSKPKDKSKAVDQIKK